MSRDFLWAPLRPGFRGFRGFKGFKGFKGWWRLISWRRKAPYLASGTVSRLKGRPFYGQAKGQLRLTWRSYAGPPQYYITTLGEALNQSGRRQPVPDRTLGAQGRRPGGPINPHARKGVSTFGNTAARRIQQERHPFPVTSYDIIIKIHKAKERRKTWDLLMC